MRKMISFKIENLSDKERQVVDAWADEQANIQQSLANIVMHVVGFVGNVDVMDFNVQKKLHTIFTSDLNHVQAPGEQMVDTYRTIPIEQPKAAETGDVISKAMHLFKD